MNHLLKQVQMMCIITRILFPIATEDIMVYFTTLS